MNARRGAVTVYFTIIFLALSLVCMTVVDAARVEMARIDVQRAVDAAVYSITTEYDQELKDRYGLLAFNGDQVSEKFKFYLNANLPNDESSLITDIYQIDIDESTITDAAATPIGYENAKNQILDYMKYRAPLLALEPFMKKLGTIQQSSNTTDSMTDKTEIVDNGLKDFALLYESLREYIAGWRMGSDGTPVTGGHAYVNGFNNGYIYTDAYLSDKGISALEYGQTGGSVTNIYSELRGLANPEVSGKFLEFYEIYQDIYTKANDLAYNQLAMVKILDAIVYGIQQDSSSLTDSAFFSRVETLEEDIFEAYEEIRENDLDIYEEKQEDSDDRDNEYIDRLEEDNADLVADIASYVVERDSLLEQEGVLSFIYATLNDIGDRIYSLEEDILDYEEDIDELREDKSDAETSEERSEINKKIDKKEDRIDDANDKIDDYKAIQGILKNDLSSFKNIDLMNYVITNYSIQYASPLMNDYSITHGDVSNYSPSSIESIRASVQTHVNGMATHLDEYRDTYHLMVEQEQKLNGIYALFSDQWFNETGTSSYIEANNNAITKYQELKTDAVNLRASLLEYKTNTEIKLSNGEILEATARQIITEVEGHLATLDKIIGELNNEDDTAETGLALDIETLCNNNLEIIEKLKGTSGEKDYHYYFKIDNVKTLRYLDNVSDSDTPYWASKLLIFDSNLPEDYRYAPDPDYADHHDDLEFISIMEDLGNDYLELKSFLAGRILDTTGKENYIDVENTMLSFYANDIELDGEDQLENIKNAEEMVIDESQAGGDAGADGDGTSDGKATVNARSLLDQLKAAVDKITDGVDPVPPTSYVVDESVRFSPNIEIYKSVTNEGVSVDTSETTFETRPDVDDDVSNENSDDVVKMMKFFASVGETIKKAIADLRDNVYVNEYIMGNFKNKVTEYDDQTLSYVNKILDDNNKDTQSDFEYDYMNDDKSPLFRQGGEVNPTGLNYEVEYVLNGKTTDDANYTATKWKIMAIRIPMNLIYLYTHTPERDVALSMATLLCAGIFAFLAPIVQFVILGIWAYAESEHDLYVMTRRVGGTNYDNRVAFIKSPTTFFYTVNPGMFEDLAVNAINTAAHSIVNTAIEGIQAKIDGYVSEILSGGNEVLGGSISEWLADKSDAIKDIVNDNIDLLAAESEAYVQTVFDEFELCVERIIIDTLSIAKNEGKTIEEALSYPVVVDYRERLDKLSMEFINMNLSDLIIQELGNGTIELSQTQIMAKKNDILVQFERPINQFTSKLEAKAKELLNDAINSFVEEINKEYQKYADLGQEYLEKKTQELTSKIASVAAEKVNQYVDVIASEVTESLTKAITENIGENIVHSSPVDKFKFGYTDYLRLYLLLGGIINDKVKIQRILDLVNINMREVDNKYNLAQRRVAYTADVSIDMDYLFIESLMNMWNETEVDYVYRNQFKSQYQY